MKSVDNKTENEEEIEPLSEAQIAFGQAKLREHDALYGRYSIEFGDTYERLNEIAPSDSLPEF